VDGSNRRVMISSDGIIWNIENAAATYEWKSVCYGTSLFVAVAQNSSSTGNNVMRSPNGINWTIQKSAQDNEWQSVCYGNGLFVAVAKSGTNRVMTSLDGITWTQPITAPTLNSWVSVCYGNGLFVAVSLDGYLMYWIEGNNWQTISAYGYQWYSVCYGNGVFVAVGNNGAVITITRSNTGVTLAIQTAASNNDWRGICYGDGLFVAVSNTVTSDSVMTSINGINWVSRTTTNNDWYSVCYGNGLFISVSTGFVMTSGKQAEDLQLNSINLQNVLALGNNAGNSVIIASSGITGTTGYFGGLVLSDQSTFGGTGTFNNNVNINGNLGVSGTSNFGGIGTFLNNLNINGNLGITGQSTFGGTGTFLNNVNINSNLGITGQSTFGGTGTFLNNANINGNLGVSGTSTFGGIGTFNNANINGNLGVTGTSTFGGVGTFLNNLNINGNLGITGQSTFGGTGTFLDNVNINKNLYINSILIQPRMNYYYGELSTTSIYKDPTLTNLTFPNSSYFYNITYSNSIGFTFPNAIYRISVCIQYHDNYAVSTPITINCNLVDSTGATQYGQNYYASIAQYSTFMFEYMIKVNNQTTNPYLIKASFDGSTGSSINLFNNNLSRCMISQVSTV